MPLYRTSALPLHAIVEGQGFFLAERQGSGRKGTAFFPRASGAAAKAPGKGRGRFGQKSRHAGEGACRKAVVAPRFVRETDGRKKWECEETRPDFCGREAALRRGDLTKGMVRQSPVTSSLLPAEERRESPAVPPAGGRHESRHRRRDEPARPGAADTARVLRGIFPA